MISALGGADQARDLRHRIIDRQRKVAWILILSLCRFRIGGSIMAAGALDPKSGQPGNPSK